MAGTDINQVGQTPQNSVETNDSSKLKGRFSASAAAALLALSMGVSNTQAEQPRGVQIASAAVPSAKGLGQVVQLKDGTKMSFTEIVKLPEKEKNEVLDNQLTDEQFKQWEYFQKGQIQAANQIEKNVDTALNQKQGEEKNVDTALNQQEQLKQLINQLFDEQGLKTAQQEVYRSKAIIVSNILANSLTRPKDINTIELLKNMENALKNGKNPFAYISPEGKKALLAIINS